MTSLIRMTALAAPMCALALTLAGCTQEEPSTGKMDGGAMTGKSAGGMTGTMEGPATGKMDGAATGKMDGAATGKMDGAHESGKMDDGAMPSGKMSGASDTGKMADSPK